MKNTIVMVIAVQLACIGAEPPSRFKLRNSAQRVPSGSYGPSNGQTGSGPYPPSGWKPDGPLLLVPGESQPGSGSDLSPPPPQQEYGPSPGGFQPDPQPGPSGAYIPQGGNGNGNGHGNGNGFGNGNGHNGNGFGNGNGHNGNGFGNGNGHNGNGFGNGNGHNGNGHANGNGHNGNGFGNGNGHNGNGFGNGNGHNGNGHANGNGHNGNGHANGNGHNGNGHTSGNGHNGNGHANGNGHNGNGNGLDNTYLGGGSLLVRSGSVPISSFLPTFLSTGGNDFGNDISQFSPGTTYLSEPNYLASASSNLVSAVPFSQPNLFYYLQGGRTQNLLSALPRRKERELLEEPFRYQFVQPSQSLAFRGLPYGLL